MCRYITRRYNPLSNPQKTAKNRAAAIIAATALFCYRIILFLNACIRIVSHFYLCIDGNACLIGAVVAFAFLY